MHLLIQIPDISNKGLPVDGNIGARGQQHPNLVRLWPGGKSPGGPRPRVCDGDVVDHHAKSNLLRRGMRDTSRANDDTGNDGLPSNRVVIGEAFLCLTVASARGTFVVSVPVFLVSQGKIVHIL